MFKSLISAVKFFMYFLLMISLLTGCGGGGGNEGGTSSQTPPVSNFAPDASGLWQMLGHDARHTGRSPNLISNKVGITWQSSSVPASGTEGVTGLVVSSDGIIYAGHINHYLYAINWSSGSIKWQYLTQHEIVGSPALDSNGNIYVGSKDFYIYCLKPDGSLKWKFQLDSAVKGSPVVSSQNVIYVTTASRVYAFSSEGVSLWHETYDGGLTYVPGKSFGSYSSPAIDTNGTIYINTMNSNNVLSLCAFNIDGSMKWSLPLPEIEFSTPTIGDNGIIYVAGGHIANQGQYGLYAVNPDGTLLWSYTLIGMTYLSNPAIGPDGTIYIGSDDWHLYAINPNGTLKWKYLTLDSLNGCSFAIDSSGAVVFSNGGGGAIIYAIKPDGTLKWQIKPGLYLNRHPVLTSHGRIYMGYNTGILALDSQ
jgi:outer membrane protein assembly factor BamB